MILSNIPAKTGMPVLEHFVRRSACLLNPGGRVFIVVVQTLADFFRTRITAAGAQRLLEEESSAHRVFVYGPGNAVDRLPHSSLPFFARFPFYARTTAVSKIEEITVRIETLHGASGFDAPGGAVMAAAKLMRRIGLRDLIAESGLPLLVHEPGQGFFPRWLLEFLSGEKPQSQVQSLVLSGRNILGLEAARHNIPQAIIVPAVDLHLGRVALLEALPDGGARLYSLIVAFPELLPHIKQPKTSKDNQEVDQFASLWDSLQPLLAQGGVFLAAFSSADAERFDRKRPSGSGFSRLGSIKRDGFRALAYCLRTRN
jgi:hypothetical protein